jgi:hypothetical protein
MLNDVLVEAQVLFGGSDSQPAMKTSPTRKLNLPE